jgi:hypothetical protein
LVGHIHSRAFVHAGTMAERARAALVQDICRSLYTRIGERIACHRAICIVQSCITNRCL